MTHWEDLLQSNKTHSLTDTHANLVRQSCVTRSLTSIERSPMERKQPKRLGSHLRFWRSPLTCCLLLSVHNKNVIFTWPDVAASSLVLVSRPGSHWQTPIGVLQNVRNAACMCQVEVHCAIAQKVRGKGKHGANAVASDIKTVAVKIPRGLRSYAMRNKALETLEGLHLMLVEALISLSLVSELQRRVLAKVSPTFGGCPQSKHGHQNLAAITLHVSRLNAICQAVKMNETKVKPVKLFKRIK